VSVHDQGLAALPDPHTDSPGCRTAGFESRADIGGFFAPLLLIALLLFRRRVRSHPR